MAAKGALGISRMTCAVGGKDRRTATNAPPALTFRAVANSRNSLPFSSRLRTNTGIARGNRVHLRRSVSGLRRIKRSPNNRFCTGLLASIGPNGGQAPPQYLFLRFYKGKRRSPYGIRLHYYQFTGLLPVERTYSSRLLKSAMIYPSVAIRVHFR
jgi:hypothetical protein